MRLINEPELRAELKGESKYATRAALQGLLKLLQKESHCMQEVTEYPAEGIANVSREDFANLGPFFRFVPSEAAQTAIRLVKSWADGAVRHNDRWIRNVDGNGRIRCLKGLKRVDEVLAIAVVDLARYARLDAEMAPPPPRPSRVILELPDGCAWVLLETREDFVREGMAMRHCIGNGAYHRAHACGLAQFLSLRDPAGRPCVTVEARQGLLIQARAKANGDPWQRWRDEIEALVSHMGWRLFSPRATAGFTRSRFRLEFEVYAGDLDLNAGPNVAQLAERLHVSGSLVATGRDWLTGLPETLWVEGDCLVENCVGLCRPSRRLLVHGRASFRGSRNLCAGFERILVAGDLDLSGCETIARLPARIHIGGRLDITGTGLRRLPADLSVGGPIVCGEFATKSAADMSAYLMRQRAH